MRGTPSRRQYAKHPLIDVRQLHHAALGRVTVRFRSIGEARTTGDLAAIAARLVQRNIKLSQRITLIRACLTYFKSHPAAEGAAFAIQHRDARRVIRIELEKKPSSAHIGTLRIHGIAGGSVVDWTVHTGPLFSILTSCLCSPLSAMLVGGCLSRLAVTPKPRAGIQSSSCRIPACD